MLRWLAVVVALLVALGGVEDVWAGALTITGAAPGNFSTTLSGLRQTVYTTLGTYQAADTTGTNQGWNITFQATRFTCSAGVGACPVGGNSLPLNSLVMAPPTVSCATGTLCILTSAPPTITMTQNTPIDSTSAVKVASAALLTGSGTYDFTPGTVDATAGHNLSLAVPSWTYATTYTSTVTVSIGVGP